MCVLGCVCVCRGWCVCVCVGGGAVGGGADFRGKARAFCSMKRNELLKYSNAGAIVLLKMAAFVLQAGGIYIHVFLVHQEVNVN